MDINQLLEAIKNLNVSKELRNSTSTLGQSSGNEATGAAKSAATASGNPWAIAAAIAVDEVAGFLVDKDRREREKIEAQQALNDRLAGSYSHMTNAIGRLRR